MEEESPSVGVEELARSTKLLCRIKIQGQQLEKLAEKLKNKS